MGILAGLIIFLILLLLIYLYFQTQASIRFLSFITSGKLYTKEEFENLYPKLTQNKKIYIFYHVCTIGKWEEIVDEQLKEILKSGLYDNTEKIFIGCTCGSKCTSLMQSRAITENDPQQKIQLMCNLPHCSKTYENLTINALLDFAKVDHLNDNYYCYIHSKGVTARSPAQQSWRKHMMKWIVGEWKLCVDILNRGFNTVGTNSFTIFSKQHYSGNMWWTRGSYLKDLEIIETKDLSTRHQAEYKLLESYKKGSHVSLSGQISINAQYKNFKMGQYKYDTIDNENDNQIRVF